MLGTSQTRTGDGGTGHSAVQHSPAAKSAAAATAAAKATSEASATATEASATTAEAPTKATAAGTAEASAAAAAEGASENHRCRQSRRHVILRSADGCRRRSRQIHRGHLVLWALSDLRAVAAADGANGAGTSRIPDHARRG